MLYLKVILYQVKSQLEYKASVLMILVGQALIITTTIFGISLVFEKFNNISGWNKFEVLFCCSIINISFSISECLGKGFQNFKELLLKGWLDRLMSRPRVVFMQILYNEFDITRIGRVVQSSLFLFYATRHLTPLWNYSKIAALVFAIFLGTFVFLGIFIYSASVNFFSIQQNDISSLFVNGGRELGQYPISFYPKIIRSFFIYIIPIGCITYFPACFILDKLTFNGELVTLNELFLFWGVGITFFLSSILLWRSGIKKYESCGG